MLKENLKILILCGGKGERLKPVTNGIPKPLVPIRGKPILYYLLKYFENNGFKDFVVATGYHSMKIEEYFSRNHRNLKIEIVNSGDVDIVKRVNSIKHLIQSDFILCYGDTLANVNLSNLINFHFQHKRKASVTSYQLRSQFGIFNTNSSGLIESFEEKPLLDAWINIGYFIFNPSIFSYIDKSDTFVEFLKSLIKEKQLFNFKHEGIHITVNTMKELNEAEKNIKKFTELTKFEEI